MKYHYFSGGTLYMEERNGAQSVYGFDALGSTTGLRDTLVYDASDAFRYDAWGSVTMRSGTIAEEQRLGLQKQTPRRCPADGTDVRASESGRQALRG